MPAGSWKAAQQQQWRRSAGGRGGGGADPIITTTDGWEEVAQDAPPERCAPLCRVCAVAAAL
jgi:hypothetical protein